MTFLFVEAVIRYGLVMQWTHCMVNEVMIAVIDDHCEGCYWLREKLWQTQINLENVDDGGCVCLSWNLERAPAWRHSWLPAPAGITARDVDIKARRRPADSHGDERENKTAQWNDGWEQGRLFGIVNLLKCSGVRQLHLKVFNAIHV